jgi:hypothetical protein
VSDSHSPASSALATLRRETRWRYGSVPPELGGIAVPPGHRTTCNGRHLLRTDSGFGYYYAPGEGIAVERPAAGDPDEELLWLNGSAYAAVACLNGLVPLHASAIAYRGRAFAFTGPSGAGKSTLAAGLGGHGLPLLCDDTLLLDLSDPLVPVALPGHKRLKLTETGLALSAATAQGPVGAGTGKFYATPLAGDCTWPQPLTLLVFLEAGPEFRWEPINGAERFARLAEDHYTHELYRETCRPSRADLFDLRARLAAQIAMVRLIRPLTRQGHLTAVELAARKIRNWPEETNA